MARVMVISGNTVIFCEILEFLSKLGMRTMFTNT